MNYLNTIIQLLQIDDFINKDETIEIAKGKYKLHTKIKGAYKQAKRELIIKRENRWQKSVQ
jgi:hypothetical protein